MKNIQELYESTIAGKVTENDFRRQALSLFPNYLSNFNSFEDTIKILSQRHLIKEIEVKKPNIKKNKINLNELKSSMLNINPGDKFKVLEDIYSNDRGCNEKNWVEECDEDDIYCGSVFLKSNTILEFYKYDDDGSSYGCNHTYIFIKPKEWGYYRFTKYDVENYLNYISTLNENSTEVLDKKLEEFLSFFNYPKDKWNEFKKYGFKFDGNDDINEIKEVLGKFAPNKGVLQHVYKLTSKYNKPLREMFEEDNYTSYPEIPYKFNKGDKVIRKSDGQEGVVIGHYKGKNAVDFGDDFDTYFDEELELKDNTNLNESFEDDKLYVVTNAIMNSLNDDFKGNYDDIRKTYKDMIKIGGYDDYFFLDYIKNISDNDEDALERFERFKNKYNLNESFDYSSDIYKEIEEIEPQLTTKVQNSIEELMKAFNNRETVDSNGDSITLTQDDIYNYIIKYIEEFYNVEKTSLNENQLEGLDQETEKTKDVLIKWATEGEGATDNNDHLLTAIREYFEDKTGFNETNPELSDVIDDFQNWYLHNYDSIF